MKKRKKVNSMVKLIFEGGATIDARTTHEYSELSMLLKKGMLHNDTIVIDTVNEQDNVADDCLVVSCDKLLAAIPFQPNESQIEISKPIIKLQ